MKRSFLAVLSSLSFLVVAIPVPALTPTHLWSQRFGSTSDDQGFSVAVDNSGNVFVTGSFQGTVDFGGGPLVSAGGYDIFVAKYSAGGVHLWSQRFGSTGSDEGHSVAVDGSGNVLVTGYFQDSVDFGGGLLVSSGGDDIFVAKYDADGVHQWSQRFGSTDTDEEGESVATDDLGNVFVTGYFSGTVDFGGGPLVGAGDRDIFLAKYDAGGGHAWSQRFGSTAFDRGYSVAVDGSGNVFVTGGFSGTVDFGGGALSASGGFDIFVAKYDAGGAHLWSGRFGSTGNDEGNDIAVDVSGNVVVTGYFAGTVDFGGGPFPSVGFNDIFLAKYDAGGAYQWSQSFGSTNFDAGESVAVDGSGNVFVTGFFQGSVDFGGGPLVSAGIWDIFIAKYSPSGAHLGSERFGSTGFDLGRSLDVDDSGNVLVTGFFSGIVDFGGGPLPSAGGYDIYVAKYSTFLPVITSITDIGNDQGRQVKIRFSRAELDDASATTPITRYVAFRRDDAPPATALLPRGLTDLSKPELLADGWTEVGSVGAFAENSYGIDVPTIGDSTIAQGQYYSVFFIRAATATPSLFFDSEPDSGYSLDNLAPGVPSNLVYTSGLLSWDQSPAADFDYFTVYGSNTDVFGAATVVDYTVALSMDVTGSPYQYYFVTATDFSGNEGNPGMLNAVTGFAGTSRSYALSVTSYPNPFNPTTMVTYTVPVRGNVTVAIYDARGAHVTTLVRNEVRDPGEYTTAWNGGVDSAGVVPSGIYFARIEQKGVVRSTKMLLLK